MDYEQQYEIELVKKVESSRSVLWFLYGLFFGSAVTFFADPAKGQKRRSQLLGQSRKIAKTSQNFLSQKLTKFRRLENRQDPSLNTRSSISTNY